MGFKDSAILLQWASPSGLTSPAPPSKRCHVWPLLDLHYHLMPGRITASPLPQTSDSTVFSKLLRWNVHSVTSTQLRCTCSGHLSTCVTIAPVTLQTVPIPQKAPLSASPHSHRNCSFITIVSFACSWTYTSGIVQEYSFLSACFHANKAPVLCMLAVPSFSQLSPSLFPAYECPPTCPVLCWWTFGLFPA